MDQKLKHTRYTEPEVESSVQTEERPRHRNHRRPEPTNNELKLFYRRMMRRFRRLRHNLLELLQEDRERNFPESDHRLVQLVLFVWNIIPMLFSLLREHTWGRRRELFRKQSRNATRKKRRNIHPAAFIGTGCAIAAVIMLISTYTIGTTVTYDGEEIGTVNLIAQTALGQGNAQPGAHLSLPPLSVSTVILRSPS